MKVSERLPVGTDAILQAMIWSLVLPAIEARLAACGLNPARRFLDEITGRSTTSLVVEDPYFTRRLNRKVLWPAACGLFALNEHGAASTGHGNRRVTLETLVVLGGGRIEPVAAAFDAAALQAGARGFGLADTSINLRRGQLARVIRDEIREPVLQIGRVVASQTCDLLLLGGDGTRLPVLHETMLAALPVAASRIIDLNRHLNRAAAEAMGGKPMLNAAQMLPALASALERRNLLEVSGFGPRALQLLQAGSPSERQRAALASELSRAEISMTQRALNAPVSAAVRADAAERPRERPDENTGERLATIGGRPGAIPTQGG